MLDVLCIGNVTLDVFIELDKRFKKGKKLVFDEGTKIEAKSIKYETGGGANNSAVALKKLNCKTGIFSIVGKDKSAPVILDELKKSKINTELILKDKKLKTSYSAILTGANDRVILTHSGAIKKINKVILPLNKMKAKWFHISSFHVPPKALSKIINFGYKNKIKIAWNPGNTELKQGLKKLKPLLKKTNVLFLNKKESEILTKEKNVKKALEKLGKFCKIVVITLGKNGAIAFSDGNFFIGKTKKIKKLDSTGAGDAFNSAFNAALIKNKSIDIALKWGVKNAQSVIRFIGAKNRLLTLKEIK